MKKIVVTLFVLLFSGSFLFAQCPYKYGANEEDSLKCLEQLTNFNMFNKAKNYGEAYPAWQYLVKNSPCCWDGLYTNAQNMFQNMIKAEKDSARRERLIDTLLYSYDVRNQAFPEKFSKGYCKGFQAYNILQYRSKTFRTDIDKVEELLNMFIEAVELDKENTQPVIWDKYYQLAESMTKAKRDTSYVIEAYGRATDYLDISINNSLAQYDKQVEVLDSLTNLYTTNKIDTDYLIQLCKKPAADTARQQKFVLNYRKTLAKIEKSVAPYASCDVLEELYAKKLESIKDDISAVNKVVVTMAKGGCLTSPVFKDALLIQHNAKPSRTSAYWMGMLSLNTYATNNDKAEIDAAINFLQEAVRLSENNEQRADANYVLATAYMTKGSYSEARNAAYAALKANPNFGKAYILIGDLYKASGGRCSDGIPYDTNWAAADKYSKAAAVDPSCASEANAHRATLRFPSKDELFRRGLSAGSSYHVGCWIQENTTVR
ncbi:MAG: hypothetical protein K6A41_08665 [Bacteroidales bacterium]|nr:hypothetical protein [Bacteroidales bacterium]